MPLAARAAWLRAWLAARIDGQRGYLFPWVAVAFGAGVGTYFALPWEPGGAEWACAALLAFGATVAEWRAGTAQVFALAIALFCAGLLAAGARTHLVAAPVLEFRYFGPVEGRIVKIDRSASDKTRLTLDRVVLEDLAPARTPARVRVTLHGDQRYLTPAPGLRVAVTAHLSPPRWPVEPGGFDFRRHAWFQGLGAVGYARTPALALAPPPGGAALWVERLRMRASAAVQAALPGQAGAVAAAVTTGDRSGISLETTEALRAANLAHLLAISGLHMGLLAGFVYAAARTAAAAVPWLVLRYPVHKAAAALALLAGAAYLALSGGNVATERAFVMVAVLLTAVMLDRRAFTLRSVALAALIVLAHRPEALTGPGFQMSFAATTALVAVFGAVREHALPRWARWAIAIGLSSLVAGMATAPYAAAHFGRVPHYGLIANILSVPVMGAVVMPGAVVAAVLAPLGLGWIGLWIMAPGLSWILAIANWVAGWEGAVGHVVAPGPWVLPLLTCGGLILALWHGRGRFAGLVPVALAALLWAGAERPAMLVSETGGLLGAMGPEGRALSKPRGEAFVAEAWLEADGDGAGQAEAALRDPAPAATIGLRIAHETGRGAGPRAQAACATADIVITSARVEHPPAGPCRFYDRARLEREGPLALWRREGAVWEIVSARSLTGHRPWAR